MTMILVDVLKNVLKQIKSKQSSTKQKYNSIRHELESVPFGGPIFTKLKGESLLYEAKTRKVRNCTPYSVELENRMRLVYEVYEDYNLDGVNYDYYILITDLANHEWRGKPYTRQFSYTKDSDKPKEKVYKKFATEADFLRSIGLDPDQFEDAEEIL